MSNTNLILEVIFYACKEIFPIGYSDTPSDISIIKEIKDLSKSDSISYQIPSEDSNKFRVNPNNKVIKAEGQVYLYKKDNKSVYFSFPIVFEQYALCKIFLYEIIEEN